MRLPINGEIQKIGNKISIKKENIIFEVREPDKLKDIPNMGLWEFLTLYLKEHKRRYAESSWYHITQGYVGTKFAKQKNEPFKLYCRYSIYKYRPTSKIPDQFKNEISIVIKGGKSIKIEKEGYFPKEKKKE